MISVKTQKYLLRLWAKCTVITVVSILLDKKSIRNLKDEKSDQFLPVAVADKLGHTDLPAVGRSLQVGLDTVVEPDFWDPFWFPLFGVSSLSTERRQDNSNLKESSEWLLLLTQRNRNLLWSHHRDCKLNRIWLVQSLEFSYNFAVMNQI